MQGKRNLKHILVNKVKGTAKPLAKLVHGRAKVTGAVQLFFQPAMVELVGIGSQFLFKEVFAFSRTGIAHFTTFFYTAGNRFKYRFTAEHAGLHGSV